MSPVPGTKTDTDGLCHPQLRLQHHDEVLEKKQPNLAVIRLHANRMQIYIQKCPKIEVRNRIAVRIRSVCSWRDGSEKLSI